MAAAVSKYYLHLPDQLRMAFDFVGGIDQFSKIKTSERTVRVEMLENSILLEFSHCTENQQTKYSCAFENHVIVKIYKEVSGRANLETPLCLTLQTMREVKKEDRVIFTTQIVKQVANLIIGLVVAEALGK